MTYKSSYRPIERRRRSSFTPLVVGGLAIILLALGVLVLILWWSGATPSVAALFASPTPTVTETATPLPATQTPTITLSPTASSTPEPEASPTASEPFVVTVQAGDSVVTIAEQYGVEYYVIMLLNGLTDESILDIGQELLIPDPNMGIPTPTEIPALPAGSLIEYFVLPGDSVRTIAEEFLSTEEGIIEANDLEDPNSLFVGQIILVPIRLVTPTFGPSPTNTGETAAQTPAVTDTVAPTATP